jgi:hypothetical protein
MVDYPRAGQKFSPIISGNHQPGFLLRKRIHLPHVSFADYTMLSTVKTTRTHFRTLRYVVMKQTLWLSEFAVLASDRLFARGNSLFITGQSDSSTACDFNAKVLQFLGKIWQRTSNPRKRVKSLRINGPHVLLHLINSKVVGSNLTPATNFE